VLLFELEAVRDGRHALSTNNLQHFQVTLALALFSPLTLPYSSLLLSKTLFYPKTPTLISELCTYLSSSLQPASATMGFSFISKMRIKQRWGFIVFRTDYSSDADWAKFTDMYRAWPQEVLMSEGAQRASLITSWEQMWWMDDQAKYENASVATLRKHHRAWLEGLDPKDRRVVWPEHLMFLVVDAEVMDRVREMDGVFKQLPLEQHPFVKVFDVNVPGESDEYPGWMKLSLSGLYYLYEKALDNRGMRELCVKHTDWFIRDALPEETYLVESDASDLASDDMPSDDDVDPGGS
jgi:hypothetical protein